MLEPSPRRFIALDRDGTLIEERHYLSDPAQVVLLPGVLQGLQHLRELGFGLVLITNQSGIGRGYFSADDLTRIHARLSELLLQGGVELDAVYVCPHAPRENCACRKPQPQMLQRAAQELGFDPYLAWMIGDKPCDIEIGQAVGAQTILVRTGYGAQIEREGGCNPNHVVDNLADAARVIEKSMTAETAEILAGSGR